MLSQAIRTSGPLNTSEIELQRKWWTKRARREARNRPKFWEESFELNLQENDKGVLECRERIQGDYPVYLPDNHPYTEKLLEEADLQTLHGRVTLTMAHIRDKYWVPRLRRLSKRARKRCCLHRSTTWKFSDNPNRL